MTLQHQSWKSEKTQDDEVATRLEQARGQIEARFLDGGAVLVSVLEGIDKLVATLDTVTSSLDADSADKTMAALTGTMRELKALPEREAGRQQDLITIGVTEKEMRQEVLNMRETLRYLRTFAITAKITGAGIADFAGFAAEIIEKIQYGSDQADGFAQNLDRLSVRLGPATVQARQIVETYSALIPQIVDDLGRATTQLSSHHKQLSATAAKVRQLAGGVQMKLATILSALQIGDITRQRIEHCQFAFQALTEYLSGSGGSVLTPERQLHLRLAIRLLVTWQLQQIAEDFSRDTAKIVSSVSSFGADIGHMIDLAEAMSPADKAGESSVIRQLETGIATACEIVSKIEAGAAEADALSRSTDALVTELLGNIEIIKVVRTDIQYMALNTNLRCSKIGEEGKAINVVTAELRTFAGRMDEAAEAILAALHKLQTISAHMCDTAGAEGTEGESLEGRLKDAAREINVAADAMDDSLKVFDDQGRAAAGLMREAMTKLDFKAELGDILAECAETAGALVIEQPDLTGLDEALAEIGPRIYKTYTMAAERDIHAELFGRPAAAEPAPSADAFEDDDDMLEAALF